MNDQLFFEFAVSPNELRSLLFASAQNPSFMSPGELWRERGILHCLNRRAWLDECRRVDFPPDLKELSDTFREIVKFASEGRLIVRELPRVPSNSIERGRKWLEDYGFAMRLPDSLSLASNSLVPIELLLEPAFAVCDAVVLVDGELAGNANQTAVRGFAGICARTIESSPCSVDFYCIRGENNLALGSGIAAFIAGAVTSLPLRGTVHAIPKTRIAGTIYEQRPYACTICFVIQGSIRWGVSIEGGYINFLPTFPTRRADFRRFSAEDPLQAIRDRSGVTYP